MKGHAGERLAPAARRIAVIACAALLAVSLTVACNPVDSDAIAALGGEAPGVRRGPLHRPGQPCLLCHDGALGDPPAFTVAGTIYMLPAEAGAAANETVFLKDAIGSTHVTHATNAAGNFYVTPDEWSPVYPLSGVTVGPQDGGVHMLSNVGRNGSCAACHVDPAGPGSPGHVCLTLADGGVPP